MSDSVIYVDFKRKEKAKIPFRRYTPRGVIIRPMRQQTSMFFMGGNLFEQLDSLMAFHPAFDPVLYAEQTREELGVVLPDNNPNPPDIVA